MNGYHLARRLFVLLAALAIASPAAAAEASDPSVIQVVSTNVQGKNVYIPSTFVVAAGKPHTFSLFNTTDVPHGFRIDALDLETILPPGKEVELKLPALEAGRIYSVRCQLHAAHRTATLVVIDTDH